MSLSDKIISNKHRKWSDKQIESLGETDRKALAKYNPKLTANGISVALQQMISKLGFSPADGIYAASLRNVRKTLHLSNVTPGEAIVQGGHVVVDKDTVTVVRTSGVQTLPNTPILGNIDEPDLRSNLDNVTAICSCIVKVSKGNWVDNNSQEWSDRFNVSPAGMKMLAESVIHVLTHSKDWTALSPISRQGITGIPMMRFIRRVLNNTTKSNYDLLNTIIVVDALQVVKRGRKGAWLKVTDAEGKPVVPDAAYTIRPFSPKDKGAIRDYPCVFNYTGGYIPGVKAFQSSPDTTSTSAMASFNQEVGTWAQGSNSPVTLLASGKGYATQLTDNTKRQLFLISASLSAWTEGMPVLIRLPSLGDFVPVLSSLQYWQKKILDQSPEMFKRILEYSDGEQKAWFKFILPNQSKTINNPQVMAHCVSKSEPGFAVIFVMDVSLPQKSDKAQQEPDWDTYSFTAIPPELGAHYIGITTVYGPAFFSKDVAMEKVLKSKSSSGTKPLEGCHVYSFALAKDFQAVISSFPSLALVGRELTRVVVPVTTAVPTSATSTTTTPSPSVPPVSVTQEQWVQFRPVYHATRASWYETVKRDIYSLLEFPWRPVVRSSPIVNLLFITKGKAELNTAMWVAGGGSAFVGKVFAPEKGTNIVFEAPKEDPNAEDDESEEEDEEKEVAFDNENMVGDEESDGDDPDSGSSDDEGEAFSVVPLMPPPPVVAPPEKKVEKKEKKVVKPTRVKAVVVYEGEEFKLPKSDVDSMIKEM